ncbi:MAG: glycine cleavage system aminomethyltransferase GcvT [Rhizobiales bacterium]|nr:glycine cleavage system aminomethyltransferase GcvT [Hyphomicrobiales bacterium]
MADSPSETLLETPLAAEHRALGARMVPFGGYAMPVQYPTGIIAEHKWTREHAGLFDVSHMGPSFLMLAEKSGDAERDHAAVAALVEPLVTGEIRALKPGQVRYTLMTNDAGGVIDDLMVARSARIEHSGTLYIVVNAGTKDGDFALIEKAVGGRARLHRADDGALLALQGPEAAAVMRGLVPAAADLGFMTYGSFEWQGARVMVSRSGYTGEDGFEILVPADRAKAFWDALLADQRVKPVGLGARDSLRLEAGLPLNGHDLDATTSPVEANLAFAVSKRRRAEGGFPGAARVQKELAEGTKRLRVGIAPEGKAPVREGAAILDIASGRQVGTVTSGTFGPTVNAPIAMGYVETAFTAPGTKVAVDVRGKSLPATIAEMPFVPHRYYRKPA